MKNIISIFLLLSLLSLGACNKGISFNEGITEHATWFNESGVPIKFIPFYGGFPVTKYEINLEDKDSFYFGSSWSISEGKVPGFSSNGYMTGMDSFHIIYNSKYLIAYVKYDSIAGSHALAFNNERHVGNPNNYHWWFEEDTRELFNEFTFLPEDYEYAKAHGIELE